MSLSESSGMFLVNNEARAEVMTRADIRNTFCFRHIDNALTIVNNIYMQKTLVLLTDIVLLISIENLK